jgi:hypothetical protein
MSCREVKKKKKKTTTRRKTFASLWRAQGCGFFLCRLQVLLDLELELRLEEGGAGEQESSCWRDVS